MHIEPSYTTENYNINASLILNTPIHPPPIETLQSHQQDPPEALAKLEEKRLCHLDVKPEPLGQTLVYCMLVCASGTVGFHRS